MTLFLKYSNNKDIGKMNTMTMLLHAWWIPKFNASSANALCDIDMFHWITKEELKKTVCNQLDVIKNDRCIIKSSVSFIICYELEICHA